MTTEKIHTLLVVDFDSTLIDSPRPNPGKEIWEKKKGKKYPHKGWWGRKESLDTDVFNIKYFPTILSIVNQGINNPNTKVIILTSRLEKLRFEVEKILKLNNIYVDELIMKKGNEDKGDVILNYVKNNPDLKQIDVYDDFANKQENKILELTKIKNDLPDDIEYNLYYVENGGVNSLLESTSKFKKMLFEEIIKIKSQYL